VINKKPSGSRPTSDELTERGKKKNLDIFRFKDGSLEDTKNLPEPDVLASDIVKTSVPHWSSVVESRRNWKNQRQCIRKLG